jgi:hypothetical protein
MQTRANEVPQRPRQHIRPHLEHFQKLGSIKQDGLTGSGRRSLEREAFVDGVWFRGGERQLRRNLLLDRGYNNDQFN